MIDSVPVSQLAPLDYRYALDAALALLGDTLLTARCDQPELAAELAQRLPATTSCAPAAALWVEPQQHSWREALVELAAGLAPGGLLAIVTSQSLARLLPERRAWAGAPLCLQPGGVIQLRQGLASVGLRVKAVHGAHSLGAIGLNSVGGLLARAGRPDLGDRLEFAARLHYGAHGFAAGLATVAVTLARKGVDR